jgi:hypothetical protein
VQQQLKHEPPQQQHEPVGQARRYDKLTGKTSAITFHLSLPDVLLTSANASSEAKYYYLP